jgi:hypothetical protein
MARTEGGDGLRPRCGPPHAPGCESLLEYAFTGAFHDAGSDRQPQGPVPRLVHASVLILEIPDRVGDGGRNVRSRLSECLQRREYGIGSLRFQRLTQGPRPRLGLRRRLTEQGMASQRYSRA